MDTNYILSQIFIVFYYIFLAITYTLRSRKSILIYNIFSTISIILSYFFLSAWSGFAMNVVALIRDFIFMFYDKSDGENRITKLDIFLLIGLTLISVVLSALTFNGFLSLFPLFATLTYTFSIWQKNRKLYRILGIFVSMFSLIYLIYVFSFFGIILESILLLVTIIGVILLFTVDKKEKKEVKEEQ